MHSKYIHNTTWLLLEKIVKAVSVLFTGIWVARYLGPEQFGLLSYSQSLVIIMAVIAPLGLDFIVIKKIVEDKNKQNIILGTAFTLRFISSIITVAFIFVIASLYMADTKEIWLIYILSLSIIFQSSYIVDFYFQSQVISKFSVLAKIISLILVSIVKVILILNSASIEAFAWAILFENIVLALGFIYFYQYNKLSFNSWCFSRNMAYELLSQAWPLILSGVAVSIYMRLDQIMIKNILGNHEVGQYAAAVQISESWYFLGAIILSSLFPAMIKSKSNEATYRHRLEKIFSLMIFISIMIAIPVTFLSDWITNIIYGDEYLQSSSVLIIHVWLGLFVFLGTVSSKILIIDNLHLFIFIRAFLGLIVNVCLNYILIPIYGLSGAAIATLLSYILVAYFSDILHKKTRYIFYLKTKSILFWRHL
jgi:O-antigen/teichoic acid export membrane protein